MEFRLCVQEVINWSSVFARSKLSHKNLINYYKFENRKN